MSAEVLRRAASLMRERAEDASLAIGDEHWNWDIGWCDPHGTTYDISTPEAGLVAATATEEIAEHLSPLRPAFMRVMADWLDFVAEAREVIDGVAAARSRNGAGWLVPVDTASQVFRDMEQRALAVARAYLGAA